MPNTYTQIYIQIVFAVRGRRNLISKQHREEIHTMTGAVQFGVRPPADERTNSVLVTGDKAHFGRFYGRALAGVTIHSPRSLAEALLSR